MSFQKRLSQLFTLTTTLFALGARAYQMTRHEAPEDRQLGNALLGAALNQASQAMNHPEQMSQVLSAVIPAGICILHAYYQGTPQRSPEPVAGVRMAPVPPARVAVENTSLAARLTAIGFSLDNVPEEFNDPITFELMEDPVIAVTAINNQGREQRTERAYDRSSFNKLNGICPVTRQPFIEVRTADELKKKMVAFVEQKEQLAAREQPAFTQPARRPNSVAVR